MSAEDKKAVKPLAEIEQAWNEAGVCFTLIRQRKDRIMIAMRRDGRTYRYTKLR